MTDHTTLEEYTILWGDSQGLTPEELLELGQTDVQLSADLQEATYNIPFEVLDENCAIFDEVMENFMPWRTFHKLFKTHQRVVDMKHLIDAKLWTGPQEITSTRGSFMGDGMSFIHLTFLLSGLVRAACIELGLSERPLGQSVGDDLVLLKTSLKLCLQFCLLAEQLGCKFSKINSVSEDTATFCEEYVAKVSDLETFEDLKGFANSIFGDLMFLDLIKGSLMSGRSKIKADGKSPFIGHASALNKTLQWNPIESTKTRGKIFLWASNFMEAKRLGSAMASLPHPIGGADLAVGTIIEYSDRKFKEGMLPYYERMLTLEPWDFLKYYVLLSGIYKANPKGFAWENDWKVISEVLTDSTIIVAPNFDTLLPEGHNLKKPIEKLRFINDTLRLVSVRNLSDELCRRDAFHKLWNGKVNKAFMTLKISNVRQRVNHAWAIIKSNLEPVPENEFRTTSMRDLTWRFQEKSWGFYVSRDDEAISRCFQGTPSMFLDTEDYIFKPDRQEENNLQLESDDSDWS